MSVGVCWQYLRKLEERENECPLDFNEENASEVQINEIDYHIAKDFIIRYEWLRNMGTSKYSYGLFIKNTLVAVVCYGPLVAPTHYINMIGPSYSKSIMQLCRGASTFSCPKWGPSKLISTSLKLLCNKFGTKMVIAYADPNAGEIGTIYQACNAVYLGMTSPGGAKRYIIHGHSYDPRKVHKKFGSRSHQHLIEVDPNYETVPINPKHRYLFILAKGTEKRFLIRRLQSLIKQYPKKDE